MGSKRRDRDLKADAMQHPCVPGNPGVLHGNRTYLMEDENGQIIETHSISAGLDYPGVGPEHAWLKDSGRARYAAVTDDEALQAFHDSDPYRRYHSGTGIQSCPGLCYASWPRHGQEQRPF